MCIDDLHREDIQCYYYVIRRESGGGGGYACTIIVGFGKHVHKCLCHSGRVRRRVRFHFTRACCSWGGWIDKNGITSSFFFLFLWPQRKESSGDDGWIGERTASINVRGWGSSLCPSSSSSSELYSSSSLSLSFPGHIHCTKSSIPYVWIAFFYLLIMQLGYIVL